MKSLDTLIKLYRRNLDETRRELVKEETFREEAKEILSNQRSEMSRESQFASSSLEASFLYGNYINRALKREEKIIEVIENQDMKIDVISEKMFEQFGELKRYEIISDIKKREREKEEARLEQIELDEIATNSFLQKREHE